MRVWATLFILILIAGSLMGQERRDVFVDGQRTLRVIGTNGPDTIVAEVGEDAIRIDFRGTTASFRLDAFDRLDIDASGGDDFVNLVDPAERLDAQRKAIRLRGGDGDNAVVLSHASFPRDAVARLRALASLSTELQQIAGRANEATTNALLSDTMKYVQRLRAAIVDESQAMSVDAQRQLLGPGSELVDRSSARMSEQTKTIFERVNGLSAQHEQLVAALTKRLDPTPGVLPPEDTSEPARELPPTGPEPSPESTIPAPELARAEELARAAEAQGDDARTQIERSGADIERSAAEIEQRAGEFERRAERLEENAERLALEGERELSASSDRVLAVVAELRSLTSQIEAATRVVRLEILRAIAGSPPSDDQPQPSVGIAARPAAATASSCSTPIQTTHSYAGGNGFDIFFPFSAPNASWSITGGNGFNILFGGFKADDIRGGSDTDIVFGLKGDDHIRGGTGVDLLVGEFIVEFSFLTGDDCIWGEDDIDLIVGDNLIGLPGGTAGGADFLSGGEATDLGFGDDVTDFVSSTLAGGVDTIEGNNGDDVLFGCGGGDTIDGNNEIDFVVGNGGGDTIRGHGGRTFNIFGTQVEIGNLLIGSGGNDKIHGGSGIDLMLGNENDDQMWGDSQLDVQFGGLGNDEIRGEAGGVVFTITINNVKIPVRLGNVQFGGPHQDKIFGGGDLDVQFGQADEDELYGFDQQFFVPNGIDMDVQFGGAADDILEGDDEFLALNNSHDLQFGGDGEDLLRGGANADLMFGQRGRDTMEGDSNLPLLPLSSDLMFGGIDDDSMDGGTSFDLMFGNGGSDSMIGDNEGLVLSPDLIFGNAGPDVINGGSFSDLIFGNDGDDRILGDSNYIWQVFSSDIIFGNRGNDDIDGGNAEDLLFGNDGCDHILGDDGTVPRISLDTIFGNAGDDHIDGGASTDLVWGNSDNDTITDSGFILSADFLWGNEGCDRIDGGQSADFIWGNAGVDHLSGDGGPDLIWGGDNSDTISGGDFLDLLWGNEGNDLVHGDNGPDVIFGNVGDDCLFGDDGPDLVFGNEGNDCLRGGNHSDVLFGNDGDDRIFGDNGPDVAFAGGGDDKLDGGSGADVLVGGSGSDEAWGGPGVDVLFAESRHQQGSSGLDCDCRLETCVSTVCVRKFDDTNGNGAQNSGEASLPNWTFQIACGCASAWVTTDANGNACATFLGALPCTVTESMQSGWTATTPTTQSVNASPGQTDTATFGNRRPLKGELCIRKFNDANGNGVLDAGEAGVPSFVFTLVGSGGVATTLITNVNGSVCTSVAAGAYTIIEQPQSGWTPTTATTQTVVVNPGAAANVAFGNTRPVPRGEICVQKFSDKNRNGVHDTGEQLLGGWTFQINGGSAGTLTTNPVTGGMCGGFPAGTYTVTEVPQAGWTPTTPTTQTVTVTAGQATIVKFGNAQP